MDDKIKNYQDWMSILTQLRAFDTLRISGKKPLGRINKDTFKFIKNKLSKLAQF